MQRLQVNISDRYTCATNGFYSTLFGPEHVGNRDTKAFIYSCIASHSTMRRTLTQAKLPVFNSVKGLKAEHETLSTFNPPWKHDCDL